MSEANTVVEARREAEATLKEAAATIECLAEERRASKRGNLR